MERLLFEPINLEEYYAESKGDDGTLYDMDGMEIELPETSIIVITLTVNTGSYADAETIAEEIGQSLEWMVPTYGDHDAIFAGTWKVVPERFTD